ncbi:Cell cycle checkpoint control protein RAD9A [Melipona quadrifasciata]|uniref:Cell cycle checkpoint control protein n=1 Tax=Melipona quadrifasciata TaxID=166423 RepID=A0A0N0U4G0_9HYME|nr:Cell cycle checkpoint control protein RAD9A [Melipona quadrifasciata]
MKCVIAGANVKSMLILLRYLFKTNVNIKHLLVLAKAIHALTKIGDEMYIEPHENTLSFRTVNMPNSAYADFTFLRSYFSYYVYGDLQESDALKCKISMRSAIAVFKSINLIDKQVESCHINLESDASEILFILKYKNGITKTHLLPILDCEVLQDSASIKLSSQSQVLGDAMQNFHQNLVEITLEVCAQKLLLRNYVDDTSGLSNTIRTQFALGKGEFDRYDIGSETSITFCVKEFKSFLNFAESVVTPISMYFEEAGRPVIFALKNQSFEVNLVLSTLCSDLDSQAETVLTNKPQETSMRGRAKNKRVPKRNNNISSNKIQDKSIKSTLGNDIHKKSHPHLMEEQIKQANTSTEVTKRKSNSNDANKEENLDDQSDLFEDKIPNSPSPPNKKARLIFQKCFQKTFDPRTLPGYDVILVEDSD